MKAFALLVSMLLASGSIDGQQPALSSTLPGRNIPTAGTDTSGFGAGEFGGGSAAVRSGETAPTDLYGAGLLREEGEGDLASAEAAYRLAIQQFDRQREWAANAIFRLGEVYRKMGRTEEAKVQYARILREFPDMVRLTELSHAQLIGEEGRTRATSQTAPAQPILGTGTAAGRGAEQDPTDYEQMMMERYGIVPGARSQVDNERDRAASWADFDPAVHMTYEYHGESVGETDAGKLLFRCPIHGHVARADGSVMLGPDPSRPVAAGIDSVLLQRYGLGAGTAEPAGAVGIVNRIINNLRQIEGAKEQWALEKRRPQGAQPAQGEVADYVRGGFPTSLAGERYEINPVGMPPVAVLTQPLGNRKPGERITIAPPDQVVEMRQTEPIRIQVREDGSIEVNGEAIAVEVDALGDRLRQIAEDRRSAVLKAEDRSPPESLMTVIEAAYAAKLRPVEVDAQARTLIQREAARWAEEIADLSHKSAPLLREAVRLRPQDPIRLMELEQAEERVIPARQRLDASYSDPVRLPGMISQDERYQKLRAQYEAAVLDGDEEAAKRARARLKQWVEQIYQPELQEELNFAQVTVERIRSRQKELQAQHERMVSQYEQMQQQLVKLHQRLIALKAVIPDLEVEP